jgi:hypothetical protein
MDKQQILRLKLLGIETNQVSLHIFDDLLKLAEELYEELSIKEEDRMRHQIYLLSKQPTN